MPTSKNEETSPGPAVDARRWIPEYGDILYRFALLRVRDSAVAEELVQETFLAALSGLQSFQGHSSERTWLVGILKHKIVDHFRRATREQPIEDMDAEVAAYFNERGEWAIPPSVLDNPARNIEQNELRHRLVQCLSGLPERLSRAFVLTQVDGFSAEEVCKLEGITATNLWVMLHRARLRLRHCLEKMGFGATG